MATISARVDDRLKADAENIANTLGIPLSTAITVFLKRFTSEKGFPFDVVVTKNMERSAKPTAEDLENMVKQAVADKSVREPSSVFSYVDPVSNDIRTFDILEERDTK